MKKDLLVFDCFGVCYNEIAPLVIGKYFDSVKAKEILSEYFPRIDRGFMSLEEAFEEWQSKYGLPLDEIRKSWSSGVIAKPETLQAIKRLNKTYDIVLLSNAPKGMVEKMFKDACMLPYFKKLYVSSALGLAKPDKAIYEYVIKDTNNAYETYTMIDDNESNLVEPRNLGWKTIRFKSIEDLAPLFKD